MSLRDPNGKGRVLIIDNDRSKQYPIVRDFVTHGYTTMTTFPISGRISRLIETYPDLNLIFINVDAYPRLSSEDARLLNGRNVCVYENPMPRAFLILYRGAETVDSSLGRVAADIIETGGFA